MHNIVFLNSVWSHDNQLREGVPYFYGTKYKQIVKGLCVGKHPKYITCMDKFQVSQKWSSTITGLD